VLIDDREPVQPLLVIIVKCLFVVAKRTYIPYNNYKRGEGTGVRDELIKSMERNYTLDMVYMAEDGAISKRRIKMMQVGEVTFRAYCYLRKSNRTFKIGNIFALVPVTSRERIVV